MGLFDKWFKKRTSILVNGNLTVTFIDGSQVIFHEATKKMYDLVSDKSFSDDDIVKYYYEILEENRIKNLTNIMSIAKKTVNDIIQVKEAEKQVKVEKAEEVKKEVALVKEVEGKFPLLTGTGDFSEKDGSLYMQVDGKQIPLSLPNALLKRFVDLAQKIEGNNEDALEEYMALKNFWMWLSLNPKADNRERLYDFITRNDLKINKYGLFFAYRTIVATDKGASSMDKAMITAISDFYLKIKKAKKGPGSFNLYMNDTNEYSYAHKDKANDGTLIGNIADLYAGLADAQEQMFTDNYTHTFDIRIGREVSQDPNKCNFNSSVTFSRGLHNGSVNYGLYNGFGDTPILTLINPMKVCAVPTEDVLRSTAYLPVSIITEKTATDVLKDSHTLDIADEYYTDSVKELKRLIKEHTPKELKVHQIMGDLSQDALNLIANSVENIEETLQKRVIKA